MSVAAHKKTTPTLKQQIPLLEWFRPKEQCKTGDLSRLVALEVGLRPNVAFSSNTQDSRNTCFRVSWTTAHASNYVDIDMTAGQRLVVPADRVYVELWSPEELILQLTPYEMEYALILSEGWGESKVWRTVYVGDLADAAVSSKIAIPPFATSAMLVNSLDTVPAATLKFYPNDQLNAPVISAEVVTKGNLAAVRIPNGAQYFTLTATCPNGVAAMTGSAVVFDLF